MSERIRPHDDHTTILTPAPRARQLRWLALAAIALVALALLAWAVRQRGSGPSGDDAGAVSGDTFRPSAQQLKTFTIEAVAMHPFASVVVTDGRIATNADRTTPVYTPFSGRIVALNAGFGDQVTAGATLATIEASEFVQAQNDLAAARAQLRLTSATAARRQELYAAQGASLQDLQQAEADHATAEAAQAAVENRLRILGRTDAEIAALEAGAPIAARVALRTPLAGVVVDRQAAPGQYVQAGGGTALYTIADTRTVWAIGNVPESEAPHVRRGQSVAIRVPAWPSRDFSGRLGYVAATVDPVTHRLTVRAEIENADGALKPEMLATLRIATSATLAVAAVPEGAVVHEGERAHVWVVRDGDVIGLREIRIGRVDDGLVEVLDGLKAGERIVTRGSLFIDRAARHD